GGCRGDGPRLSPPRGAHPEGPLLDRPVVAPGRLLRVDLRAPLAYQGAHLTRARSGRSDRIEWTTAARSSASRLRTPSTTRRTRYKSICPLRSIASNSGYSSEREMARS